MQAEVAPAHLRWARLTSQSEAAAVNKVGGSRTQKTN